MKRRVKKSAHYVKELFLQNRWKVTAALAFLLALLLFAEESSAWRYIFPEQAEPVSAFIQAEESRMPEEDAYVQILEENAVPDEYVIGNFGIVYQEPELPTGCEITALTMALNYYGFPVDKMTMAESYLPTAPLVYYTGADGRLYGTDMNNYFVGDPASSAGIICGTGAIITAADGYLADAGSDMRAVDRNGASCEELYGLVSRDIPVVVWVTVGMAARGETQGWYTESGDYVEWSHGDHGAVLIGYSENTVTIADPISGMTEYSRTAFESVFQSRGNQCVTLE